MLKKKLEGFSSNILCNGSSCTKTFMKVTIEGSISTFGKWKMENSVIFRKSLKYNPKENTTAICSREVNCPKKHTWENAGFFYKAVFCFYLMKTVRNIFTMLFTCKGLRFPLSKNNKILMDLELCINTTFIQKRKSILMMRLPKNNGWNISKTTRVLMSMINMILEWELEPVSIQSSVNARKKKTIKDMLWRKSILSDSLMKKNLSFRNFCQLLRHESNIMGRFDHPNLLKFRETIKAKNKIYIITELV